MTDISDDKIDYSNYLVSSAELKQHTRDKIEAVAGDRESVQGSIADCAQITMLAMGQLLKGLQSGQSVDDIIACDAVFAASLAFAQARDNGQMKVPFEQKPQGEAMGDLIERTNAVASQY